MLPDLAAAPYDWADGEMAEGGLVGASRPGYRQVAAELREQILSGAVSPGTALPPFSLMAAERRVSQATVSAAVAQLAAEGLVLVEHGKPTVVRERRAYLVDIVVSRPSGSGIPDGEAPAVGDAVGRAAAQHPEVRSAVAGSSAGGIAVRVEVVAATPARAHAVAEAVTAAAAAGDGTWSWDGWDLSTSSVTVRPA